MLMDKSSSSCKIVAIIAHYLVPHQRVKRSCGAKD